MKEGEENKKPGGKAALFGRSAILLAAMAVVAKLIGALYRVPLTNIIGAEGMGLYQMVFPLYTVLLAFCGAGFSGAVSRLVAKYTALGNEAAAARTVRVAFLPLAGFSAAAAVAVALLRNVISGIQGNPDAGICYLAICPSLFFASGIGVLRGYFQGKLLTLPSGVSQLIEQSVKLVLGLYLSGRLLRFGLRYAVAGALAGVSVGELIALVYLSIRYAVAKSKRVRYVRRALIAEASAEFVASAPVSDGMLLKELYSFALSVLFGSLILPVTQMLDSVLVINLLLRGGADRGGATALFGLFVGPVGTLINMPSVVAMSVSVAYLPAIAAAVERGESAREYTKSAAMWIMLFAVPVTAAFLFFPDKVCAALYTKGLTAAQLDIAARLLRVEAISVFYIGVLQLVTTVLQGYNKAHLPVINLVVGACIKMGLTPLLVRAVGITGAAAATAACYAVAATLSSRSVYRLAPVGLGLADGFIKPAVCTAAGVAAFMLAYAVLPQSLGPLWHTGIAGGVFLIVYAALLCVSVRKISDIVFRRKKLSADSEK